MATIAQMLVAVGVDNSGFTRPSAADRERWEKAATAHENVRRAVRAD